jgi:hypothetical protein
LQDRRKTGVMSWNHDTGFSTATAENAAPNAANNGAMIFAERLMLSADETMSAAVR